MFGTHVETVFFVTETEHFGMHVETHTQGKKKLFFSSNFVFLDYVSSKLSFIFYNNPHHTNQMSASCSVLQRNTLSLQKNNNKWA